MRAGRAEREREGLELSASVKKWTRERESDVRDPVRGECVRVTDSEGGRGRQWRGEGSCLSPPLLQPLGLLESPAVWSEGQAGEVRFHYLSLCVMFPC